MSALDMYRRLHLTQCLHSRINTLRHCIWCLQTPAIPKRRGGASGDTLKRKAGEVNGDNVHVEEKKTL